MRYITYRYPSAYFTTCWFRNELVEDVKDCRFFLVRKKIHQYFVDFKMLEVLWFEVCILFLARSLC